MPEAWIFDFLMPAAASASRTALARRWDSCWLAAASPCPSVCASIRTLPKGPACR
jgi:hypothetical protein